MDNEELLRQSQARQDQAREILAELGLMAHWIRFGRPVVVGAVAHGLVWVRDIDMEVYCPQLNIEHGFEVMAACAAASPRVTSVYFENHLAGDDKALYWQIKYEHADGGQWKIDMWSAPRDYALPRGEHLLEPMQRALTPRTREIILGLKRELTSKEEPACFSIDLYRAVLQGGVQTMDDLRAWLETNPSGQLTDWRPEG